MLDKAKIIIAQIPLHDVEQFYCDLVGNTCKNDNDGCRHHIIAKLFLCHKWYRYKKEANIKNAITVYRIRVWLNHMSDKYDIGVFVKVPDIGS